MNSAPRREKAEQFRRLHDRSRILVLPNAWDAASARLFEETGFPAIGTTSAGVANSLGYPDGEQVPKEEMIGAIRRICRVVSVPVTADIEAGYAADPEALAATIREVIDAGAVGVNLEDSSHGSDSPLRPIPEQVERIRATRAAAEASGVPLVINARIDVILRGVGGEEERVAETVRRGRAYLEAGADCLFPIMIQERAAIQQVVKELDAPVNVLVAPGLPPIPELEQMGVARLSLGASAMRACLSQIPKIVADLQGPSSYAPLLDGVLPGAKVNSLFRS